MGRIITIVGSVIAVAALFIQKASSAGEEALERLSQANPNFPADLNENTIVALYNDTAWAAIVFGIAAVVAFVVAVMPPIKEPMKRVLAITASAMGAIMLLVGIFATLGAMDDADTLETAFNQAAEAGAIPVAFTVSIGYGWYVLIFAGAVVLVGGIIGLMAKSE
jgi:hypothetical protein